MSALSSRLFRSLVPSPQSSHTTPPVGVHQTPVTNRGLKFQTDRFVSVDYLCATVHLETLETLHKIVNDVSVMFLDEVVWEHEKGIQCGRYYKSRASSVHGIQIAFHEDESGVDARISISGKPIRRIGQRRFFDVGRYLYLAGFKCTRIDDTLDDFTKELPFEIVEDWLERGCAVGYKDGWKFTRTGKKGRTIDIGSRQSDKRFRYYDKAVESKGELDCYRWEGEFHNSKAQAIFGLLFSQEWDEQRYIKDLIDIALSGVDFRERSVNANIKRCPEVAAWQCFKDAWNAEHLSIPSPKPQSTVEKKMNWMQKALAPTLNILRRSLGDIAYETFMHNLLINGERRMKSHHEAIIKLYEKGWDDSRSLAETVWKPAFE